MPEDTNPEQNPPLEYVDVAWLEQHLASLRREIEAQPEAELRKAAKLTIVAGDTALDDGDIRHAALQLEVASFLMAAVKKRIASPS